jgi:hypothetical protein
MILSLGITPKRFAPLGSSNDADAQAFITAAGITDGTQQSAVNQLVLDLKSANIWTKIKAIYPIVGGSASTHKWNLKDPRDLDAAFRLNFSLGWTHASTGITPINAFANTFLNPTAQSFGQNEGSYGLYSRTSRAANNGLQHGTFETGKYSLLIIYGTGNVINNFHNSTTQTSIANANSQGFFQMSRTSSTNTFHSKNNTVTTVSLTSTGIPNLNFYFGARNTTTGATNYDSVELSLMYIAKDGLSSSELVLMNTLVTAYQTTLGRNV